jgi:hypothetical protein
MLLLHQSAIIDLSAKREASGKNKSLAEGVIFIAPEGFEPSYVMMKTLCLNHLTIGPKFIPFFFSPVQVSHLLQLVTKQLHYFYANQT